MKKILQYLLAMMLCLSAFTFSSCAEGEYMVTYDTAPTVYYHPYPVYHYRYYAPRRVYHKPTPPPPPRRPAVAPKPQPKPHGNTPRPYTGNHHRRK